MRYNPLKVMMLHFMQQCKALLLKVITAVVVGLNRNTAFQAFSNSPCVPFHHRSPSLVEEGQ